VINANHYHLSPTLFSGDGDINLRMDVQIVFYVEPYTSFWKRLSVNLMRVLPIDSML